MTHPNHALLQTTKLVLFSGTDSFQIPSVCHLSHRKIIGQKFEWIIGGAKAMLFQQLSRITKQPVGTHQLSVASLHLLFSNHNNS